MNKETEAPRRYAFNHDGQNLMEILGLPVDYNIRVSKSIKHAAIEHSKSSMIFEHVLNDLKPRNTVEAAYIGYAIGGFMMEKLIEMEQAKGLIEILESLHDNDEK